MNGPPAPQRVPVDPAAALASADAVTQRIRETIQRAATFTEDTLQSGVNGEWSTVQSLRHMTFVIDVWLSRTILGADDPFHPIGLPPHFVGATIPGSSIDPAATPTFAEACDVLNGRLATVRAFVSQLSTDDLARTIGTHAESVAGGLGVIFDELTFHDGFVNRDLDLVRALH